MRKMIAVSSIVCLCLFILGGIVFAQNINQLRLLDDEDWLRMSTDERLKALNASNNRAMNQTFVGNFGRYHDLYPRWGYDYYEMETRYENFAFRGFENYNIIEDRRQKWYYNQFGDRLTKMTRSASIWYERYNDDGSYEASGPGGYMNSQIRGGTNTRGGEDGIWVGSESTDDWAISAIGAGSMRAKLTPLTLSIPNLEGMKVDFQSANYEASMVNFIMLENLGHDLRVDNKNFLMLRGGQIRRKFGALTLGATYANLYAVLQNRDQGTDLRGTVSDYAPTPILYAVRIADDSPHDGEGPIIHDVKIKVNGRYRPDIIPQIIIDDLRRELVTATSSISQYKYLEPGSSGAYPISFDQLVTDERIPKYLDYLYMNDYTRGWNTKILTDNFDVEAGKKYYKIVDSTDKPVRVNGQEYVVYLFDIGSITDRVNRVEAEVTVANDYRIQTSHIYTKKKTGGHDAVGDNYSHYNASYWVTAAQADGNIKDGSNLRTISVDFGYEVGNTIYGFDAHFNYLGFKVNGEYVINDHYYMFSDGVPGTGLPSNPPQDITARTGYRSRQSDTAYYLVAQKDWKMFGFAGEMFKMGKFYRPYINYWMASDIVGDLANSRNDTMRIPMIEDNDDEDQYPDTMFKSRVMAYKLQSLFDPDGVFPGNDLDFDGIPDNEKNHNTIPDYTEPFLMFDSDPDEFVFGDDFNNNTIPDFRENDMKYDTPYDLDRKGHHFYLKFTPQRNFNMVFGSLKTRGVGLDNRTDNNYLKTNINYDVFTVGSIFAEYRYERIQDNIQDKFVVVPTTFRHISGPWYRFSSYQRDLYYDEIEYRNSRVSKFFLESRIRAIPSLTIENHVKFERNAQIEGTMYDNTFQPHDIVTTFGMVNKFVYTKKLGNWTFSPGLKFRVYKKNRSESLNPLDHYLMRIPMVILKYTLSPATILTMGMQGFKGFEMVYKDYIQDHNDYRQVNYVLQIENKSTYFGFEVWGGFGLRMEQIMFDKKYRVFEEYKSSTFFTQLWLGY